MQFLRLAEPSIVNEDFHVQNPCAAPVKSYYLPVKGKHAVSGELSDLSKATHAGNHGPDASSPCSRTLGPLHDTPAISVYH